MTSSMRHGGLGVSCLGLERMRDDAFLGGVVEADVLPLPLPDLPDLFLPLLVRALAKGTATTSLQSARGLPHARWVGKASHSSKHRVRSPCQLEL